MLDEETCIVPCLLGLFLSNNVSRRKGPLVLGESYVSRLVSDGVRLASFAINFAECLQLVGPDALHPSLVPLRHGRAETLAPTSI